ncbi:MAG: recombination mediator RecR [Oscillospiraceae bacterium]|nr:recombination mediator RecR [Oscillospiraceae bacterium]
MEYQAIPLLNLIEQFESLPGIGKKSAQRLAYYFLQMDKERVDEFIEAVADAHGKIKYCKICFNFTEDDVCAICDDRKRTCGIICVVETPKDVAAFERSGNYDGLYHVLGGLISPMNGIGPEQLFIKELVARCGESEKGINEIIMATNSTVEGETTSIYISKLLKPLGVKTSRLAYGIPVGGELEYADDITLRRALENRNPI